MKEALGFIYLIVSQPLVMLLSLHLLVMVEHLVALVPHERQHKKKTRRMTAMSWETHI